MEPVQNTGTLSILLSKIRRYEYLCLFQSKFRDRLRASTTKRVVVSPPFWLAIYQASTKCRPINEFFFFWQMLSIPFNPYTLDSNKQRVISDVVALDLKYDTRKLIKVSNPSNNVIIVTPLQNQTVSFENGQYFTQNDNLSFHVP